MKTLILSQNLDNYEELAKLTNANKCQYCDNWPECHFMAYLGHYNKKLPLGMQKIELIDAILPDYDLIWWQDTDSMIMNFSKDIESFVDDNFSFYISRDINCTNGGSFIIKNNANGKKILNTMLDKIPDYTHHGLQESAMIRDMYQQQEWQKIIKILPQSGEKGINSYFEDLYYWIYGIEVFEKRRTEGNNCQFQRGDFLVHWPGCSLEHRIHLAKSERVLSNIIYKKKKSFVKYL
jgi:hypothetical protein